MIDYAMNKKYEGEEMHNEQTTEKNEKTKRELTLELKNLFNQRLIIQKHKSRFDFLYNTYHKCLICNDILFDPVLCIDCDIIYCKCCVTDLETISISGNSDNLSPPNIDCKHENTTGIPDINRRHLEKIKVNCYFNCKTHNLDLFNYSDHIRKCKSIHDRNNKHNTQGNWTNHNHQSDQSNHNNQSSNVLQKVGTTSEVTKEQKEYSSKLVDKVDKLEITFELTNKKLLDELDNHKQLALSFKTALIDERRNYNLTVNQMLNLIAAFKPIEEEESYEPVTLIQDEFDDGIDLLKLLQDENEDDSIEITNDNVMNTLI